MLEKYCNLYFIIYSLLILITEEADMQNDVKISVIVPVYNVEPYIADCLNSIIHQSFQDIEIICVDDCGSDNSMDIVEQFAKDDNRIKILRHKENQGQSVARNTGMKIATGKYIAFVDSDDTIEKDYLSKLYDAAEKSGADVTECGYFVERKNKFIYYTLSPQNYNNFYDILAHITKCFVWTRLWRSDFLKKHNLQFYSSIYFEDILFVVKAAYYAKNWTIIDYAGYYYRVVPTSTTNDPTKEDKRDKDMLFVLNELHAFAQHIGLAQEKKNIFYNFIAKQCISPHKLLDKDLYRYYLSIFGKNKFLLKERRKLLRRRYFRISLKKKKIVLFGINLWK